MPTSVEMSVQWSPGLDGKGNEIILLLRPVLRQTAGICLNKVGIFAVVDPYFVGGGYSGFSAPIMRVAMRFLCWQK